MRSWAKAIASAAVVLVSTTLGALACNDSTELPQTPTGPSTPATTYTIQLSHNFISLMAPPGEPRSIVVTATVRTNRGDTVSQGAAVVWTTDSRAVATVTDGTVTAVGEGSTLLHARFGASEASAVITVAVPAPVNFTPTGRMSMSRTFHTATLLPNGKVLIAGGNFDRADGADRATASAEVYDPANGTFTRTGDMASARFAHSATLLPNGKVLIAGGAAHNAALGTAELTASAELYDPATGKFSPTGDMRRAQQWHAATLLTTGKVLITGGSGWSSCCPTAANPELYDPTTGVFATTGTYAGVDIQREMWGLVGISATLLRDGRVMLSAEPAAQVYDPVSGTFSRAGTMLTGSRFGAVPYISGRTATLLDDGKVLLTGGHHEDFGRFKNAELYDPTTGRFSATGDMAAVRDGHTATLLTDGTVLITGGESEAGCAVLSLGSAELYDPAKRGFASAGTMIVRREFHTATRLQDGRVLLTGGLTFDGGSDSCGPASVVPLASAELYVPRN